MMNREWTDLNGSETKIERDLDWGVNTYRNFNELYNFTNRNSTNSNENRNKQTEKE